MARGRLFSDESPRRTSSRQRRPSVSQAQRPCQASYEFFLSVTCQTIRSPDCGRYPATTYLSLGMRSWVVFGAVVFPLRSNRIRLAAVTTLILEVEFGKLP